VVLQPVTSLSSRKTADERCLKIVDRDCSFSFADTSSMRPRSTT